MELADINCKRKWLLGVGESKSPVEIDYFAKAPDKQHSHKKINEYYIVTKGSFEILINEKRLSVKKGQVLFVEPGEVHGIIKTSPNLKCFLIKWPSIKDDKLVKGE
ncbi:MAG: cupin domain-containing protein [Candidatus Diapherotrites archaeon]|nr:cupin domain-containing protein [Candidatus Diapherotrites archaeon]